MMHHEFEQLAGYQVSDETYRKIIEPMYMATNLDKQTFIGLLNKKALAIPTKAEIWKDIMTEVRHLRETYTHFTDFESEARLEALVDKLRTEYQLTDARVIYGYNNACAFPKSISFNAGGKYKEIWFIDYLGNKRTPKEI